MHKMATSEQDSGGIEGLDRLNIPQSSFTFARRTRPPPIHLATGPDESRIPLNPKLQRRESKGGLRAIFTRNKGPATTTSSILEDPKSAASELTMKGVGNATFGIDTSIPRPIASPADAATTPTKFGFKPSRVNLRSKSVKQSQTPAKASPKSNVKTSPGPPTRTSAAWDPPPLFQAYPQAIKHAQLMASALSADAILRISSHKRNNSITQSGSNGTEESTTTKKDDKVRNKHKRQISGSISKEDWIPKIFVLVTSGYLLQYAGEGSFDRLPEKMMQLGKDSVAFASDVIPGRHWVLQVSQSMTDGTPTADPRSLFSRLTFRGADYRRTATSLLLVLNSADDLDAWLAAVRREIEALGGKKHASETGKPDDSIIQLKTQSSHRFLAQMDPDRFSIVASPISPSVKTLSWNRTDSFRTNSEDISSEAAWPGPPARPSTSHQSIADSVTSFEEHQLEELRNSAHRLSHMSSGQRTFVTSQCSSPERSPTRDSNATTFEDLTPKVSIDETRPRPNASAISERRRSMQTLPIPVLESQQLAKLQRHSTYGPTGTPNFSVPNTSTRRFSSIKTTMQPTTEATTDRTKSTATLRFTRKAPPAAITIVRSLTPVIDSPSSNKTFNAASPAESSFQILQQIKASVVDIPPRSPLTAHPSIALPQRRSSLMPVGSFTFPAPEGEVEERRLASPITGGLAESSNEGPSPHLSIPSASKVLLPFSQSSSIKDESQLNFVEHEHEQLSPLPNIANTKTKIRRPHSMQIRPSINAATNIPLGPPKSARLASISTTTRISTADYPILVKQATKLPKAPGLKPISPSLHHLMQDSSAKTALSRKSMPLLVGGPPPAPPPNCALPPLPLHGSSAQQKESPVSNRRSVRLL